MMKRYIIYILILLFSFPVWAEEQGVAEGLKLAHAPIDRMDMESVKRGAKFFATTCMSCHTMKYLRYDKLAQEAGITIEKMPLNVKTWPYGVTPPDLSLVASARGVNWLYTYLHSFYADPKRPTGANNLLRPDTAMPAILSPYQGEQVLTKITVPSGVIYSATQWYDLLKLTKEGSMNPEQFDALTADLVNFLAYAAEPFHVEQRKIGWWVLGFLVIMFVLMYMLKKEYWKDVKKHRETHH